MRLLVTGAGGMLGRDVIRAAGAAGHDVRALSRGELDVTDQHAVRGAAAGMDAIINCAAWTDVDGAEEHEADARRVNSEAPGILARTGVRIVHVSTDYVFDGTGTRPYVESDPVAPLGGYGRTKLEGERAVAIGSEDFVIARSSWLFGVAGRNFVDTMLRLGADRDEVRVVADQVGCPTFTGHLAEALVELAADPDAHGIHHVAGGGQCSWADLAEATFARAGVDCRVERVTTAEFPRPAPRPAWSVLGSERPGPHLPAWEHGLDAYLAERSVPAS
jgi:dTDP-4-dehydrorhamnose reductase